MTAQSFLAKNGMRTAVLGSDSDLAIAAPLAAGDNDPAAHTDANRIGWFFDRTVSTEGITAIILGVQKFKVDPEGVNVGNSTDETPTIDILGKTSGGIGESVTSRINFPRGGFFQEFKDYSVGAADLLTIEGSEDVALTSTSLGNVINGSTGSSVVQIASASVPTSVLGTDAATSTITGAFTVAGGVGIVGATYIGGLLAVRKTGTSEAEIISEDTDGDAVLYFGENGNREGILIYNGGANQLELGGSSAVNRLVVDRDSGDVLIESTTASTSSTTGALQVVGGVGIQGDTYIDANAEFWPLGTGSNSIHIGGGSVAGQDAVGIGDNVTADGTNGTAIGHNADTGTADGTAIGAGAEATGNDSIALGVSASTNGNQSYVIGRAAEATAGQQFVVGDDNNGRDVRNVYIGGGVTTSSPFGTVRYHGTGGSGTDNQGQNFVITPGKSTGNLVGGYFGLEFAPAGGSGSSLNASVAALRIQGSADPAAFAAAGDVDGIDVYLRGQDGGAHTANDPRGGDIIITPGGAGSGGTGRAGVLDVQGTVSFASGKIEAGVTTVTGAGGSPDDTADGTTTIFYLDGGANTATLDLDASPTEGQLYYIKSVDSTNTATVRGNGNDIDGAASDITLATNEAILAHYTAAHDWRIL